VVQVSPEVGVAELAAVVGDLLVDPGRRGALAAAGRAYAASHTFAALAQRLYADVIEPAARSGLSVARLR